jgi:hypothetical protein
LKVALVEFAGIEILAGTVMLPVAVSETIAAVACALLKVTVQTATAPGAKEEGAQEIPLRIELVTLVRLVAVPPVPLTVSAPPVSVEPSAPETPTTTELAVGSVMDTVATMPFAMTFVLIPLARQI